MSFTIETVAIGDEILTGKITDTNSTFVANRLFANGLSVKRQNVIADNIAQITETLKEVEARANFAIVFGGLGPTSDDLTAATVATWLETSLVEDAESKKNLFAFYERAKRKLNPHSLKQVLFPQGTTPLKNTTGMAPGFLFKKGNCEFAFLPGVPREMRPMFELSVLPALLKSAAEERTLSKTWRCLGIFESDLQTQMDPIEKTLTADFWLGYRTTFPENHLTLYHRSASGKASAEYNELASKIETILRPWSYSDDGLDIEAVTHERLKQKGWRLALAESCTAGLVTKRLTRIPGSTQVIWGGYNTYTVDAKRAMLGITLEKDSDAVSASCTRSMAENTLRISGCEISAAITGYMGPDKGTEADPTGTIYLCVVGKGGILVENRIQMTLRDREDLQWGAATYLLNAIRVALTSQ